MYPSYPRILGSKPLVNKKMYARVASCALRDPWCTLTWCIWRQHQGQHSVQSKQHVYLVLRCTAQARSQRFGCILCFKQINHGTNNSFVPSPFSLYLLYVLSLCIFIPPAFLKRRYKEQEHDKNNKIKGLRLKEITFQNHVIPDSSPHIAIIQLFSNNSCLLRAFYMKIA